MLHFTSRSDSPITFVRTTAVALSLALATAACGSSDDAGSAPEPDGSDQVESAVQPDSESSGLADQGEELRDDITSGMDEEERDALDEGISSLDADTRFGIVADQMLNEPTDIKVDGVNIRFVFDAGSVEGSAFFDCSLVGILAEEGEVIVVEYPDGEQTC